jgi:hypothetical protein
MESPKKLFPNQKSLLIRIETEPCSSPAALRDRILVVHNVEPKSPINRAASHRIPTLGCHLARRYAAAGLPVLNQCLVDRLWYPPPLFDWFLMSSGPWSFLTPSPKVGTNCPPLRATLRSPPPPVNHLGKFSVPRRSRRWRPHRF